MAGKNNQKNISVSIDPKQVVRSGVNRSKGGYNSAGLTAKLGDSDYMSISYEWSGEKIPDFVFDLMDFIKSNKSEIELASKDNMKSFDAHTAAKESAIK